MAAEHIRHWRVGDVEIARIVEVYGWEDDITMLLPDATPEFVQQFTWLRPHLAPSEWGLLIGASALLGWWACTVTARHLDQADPSAIVWDEVIAFWLILWLVTPATFLAQAVAFFLFRLFDAAKPGPVAWADQRFKRRRGAPIGWAQGFGILFDDFVAALCTVLAIALWRFV